MMFDKKKILMAPVRFLDSIADRICAVLGALALAQFPQYLMLYLQRLGGHVDEAARNMEKYREIAKELGQSMYQYSQHLLASKDPAVFKTGQKVVQDLERYDSACCRPEGAAGRACVTEVLRVHKEHRPGHRARHVGEFYLRPAADLGSGGLRGSGNNHRDAPLFLREQAYHPDREEDSNAEYSSRPWDRRRIRRIRRGEPHPPVPLPRNAGQGRDGRNGELNIMNVGIKTPGKLTTNEHEYTRKINN